MAVSSKHTFAHCGVVRWLDVRPKWNDDAKRDGCTIGCMYKYEAIISNDIK